MSERIVRHKYSERLKVGLDCSDMPSRTKQSFADECDINKIIKGYDRNGLISHLNEQMPQYMDLVHDGIVGGAALDYHEALTLVRNAEALFSELPAELRNKFRNDPAEFLSFVDNPENQDELVELGLASRQELNTRAEQEPAKPAEGQQVSQEPEQGSAAEQGAAAEKPATAG